ncbi:hypothetical protein HU200_011878 [Digitaria exilis]|uniref:Phosphoglucomutase n=1 Tax=Digitaria exilis TaxID=1010633 RepID=A0A835KMC0_9POAL|nr:hypothetical protein HU200_011878 [Digitaria exilis]
MQSFQDCRLTVAESSAKWLNSTSTPWNSFDKQAVSCNAVQGGSAISSSEKVDFLKLQNGSDIRGVAVAGVEGEPVNLTEPVTEAIAAAFAAWLLNKKKADGLRRLRISVGHDSRISAHKLQIASTPAMFNSTLTEDERNHLPVDGAIMITASHLPYNRNGLKFFTNDGGLNKANIKDILERASKIYEESANGNQQEQEGAFRGALTNVDYMSIYASDLVQAVRKSAGDKVENHLLSLVILLIFCGSHLILHDKVLKPLGAVTTGSQFLEPDGLFPNHIPNPEDETAMKAITQAVLDNKADLGIIFDTDVDSGRELNRNRLIALMAAIVLEEHPGTTVVTDSVTSDGLTVFIENKLGKHHRFKRGYKNVIDEAIRLVKLLNKLAAARTLGSSVGSKVLTDLVEGLEEAAVTAEIRSFRDYGEAVLRHLENAIDKDPNLHKAPKNYEGVCQYTLFLLKLSCVDLDASYLLKVSFGFYLMLCLYPSTMQAQSKDDAIKLGLAVLAAVSEFSALDVTSLNKFVQQ